VHAGVKSQNSRQESSGNEEKQLLTPSRSRGSKSTQPHPSGFKEIHTHVEKLSGNKGADLNWWLEDFQEEWEDCCWDDNTQTKWFS